MPIRTLLLALVLIALAIFTIVNWQAFMTPTTLSLLVADVQAPLGLIMLVATGLMTALFLAYLVFQQAGVIFEARRYAKELQSQRELADRAEASRFTELRAFVEGELAQLRAQIQSGERGIEERLARVEQAIGERLAEATNTLSAYLGEVDDKLDRVLPPR
jgi:uncharacterized integral membrane protein